MSHSCFIDHEHSSPITMANDFFLLFHYLHCAFHLLLVVNYTKVANYEGTDIHSNHTDHANTDNHNLDNDAENFTALPYYVNENTTFEKQVTPKRYLWPDATMYYEISQTFSPILRQLIRVAMDGIQRETCVRFVEWKGKENENRVFFYSDSDPSCYSEGLGYIEKLRQGVKLGGDCLPSNLKIGGIQHEIFHALGVVHTHQRPDRDKYIDIFWDNVKRDRYSRSQINIWKQHDIATYESVPYDYSSVMHYNNSALAINPSKPTMSHKEDDSVCLGQGNGVTECDLELIRHAYGCIVMNSCKPELNFKKREFPVFWTKTCDYLW